MQRLVERHPRRARDVLLRVTKSFDTNDAYPLASLGGDALEDLMRSNPRAYVEFFAREAAHDERVAIAVCAVILPAPWNDEFASFREARRQPPQSC
jgi:hypothetical protein